MAIQSLTKLELKAIQSITDSDFYENGRDSIPWDWSVYDACSIPKRSRGGVFASLSQKEIVHIQEGEKKFILNDEGVKIRNKWWSPDAYGTMYITETGYALLDQLQLIDEDGYFIKENLEEYIKTV